jgi:hypothetical protein
MVIQKGRMPPCLASIRVRRVILDAVLAAVLVAVVVRLAVGKRDEYPRLGLHPAEYLREVSKGHPILV